ncbi:hypothetical protein ZWY2020_021869 [Hordeum vulgare]|nr:hypothetical protein ZWY2020_021869 [Hordeum vulgare]
MGPRDPTEPAASLFSFVFSRQQRAAAADEDDDEELPRARARVSSDQARGAARFPTSLPGRSQDLVDASKAESTVTTPSDSGSHVPMPTITHYVLDPFLETGSFPTSGSLFPSLQRRRYP